MSEREQWARIALGWLFMMPGVVFYFFLSHEAITLLHCAIAGGGAAAGLAILWPTVEEDFKRFFP